MKLRPISKTLKVLALAGGLVAVALIVAVAWNMSPSTNTELSSNCAEVKNHMSRHNCYLRDADALLLKQAVADKNAVLCDGIDHVFIPHDIQSDINDGVIGSLVTGEEAVKSCQQSVADGFIRWGG